MRQRIRFKLDNRGSALIFALGILVIVTIIGITSITSSRFELQIAGYDAMYTNVFFGADGGTELGLELVEQSIETAGFNDKGDGTFEVGEVVGTELNFYMKGAPLKSINAADDNRMARYPSTATDSQTHTNLMFGSEVVIGEGAAIEQNAGYEGGGKSAAAGGSFTYYDIGSQRMHERKSSSNVVLRWRHVN
ncbi:MAG: hypothetical protein HKM93_02140 [Desulfobacteraceae bacterium]|nr:hypothetical protein [Desulfobacteraceae bacterium]